MNETNPSPTPKIKAAHVIIALLAVVVLIQGIALINQNKRQTAMKRQQAETLPPEFLRNAPSRLYSRPPSPVPAPQQPLAQQPQAPGLMGTDPFEEFDAMSRRMSNMMRSAFLMASPFMQQMQQPAGQGFPGWGAQFSPAIDLEETEKAYIVRGDLPGLDKDKINLTVRENLLTIEGVRETSSQTEDQQKGFYSQERSYGSFSRSLTLPGPVDETKVSAEYKNGVLTITLPKAAGAKNLQKVTVS